MNDPISAMPAINFNTFTLGSTSQGYADVINENIEIQGRSLLDAWQPQCLGRPGLAAPAVSEQRTCIPAASASAARSPPSRWPTRLFGLVNSMTAQSETIQGGIQHDLFSYVQDNWRVTPRMTLNLGLRYELPFQWFQPKGYSETFRPGFQSTVFPGAPGGLAFVGDHGVLRSLVPTDFNGLEPRIGFAYDIYGTGKIVIFRGGFWHVLRLPSMPTW
jgi:outer membrane receptor protein involved in Fe transport